MTEKDTKVSPEREAAEIQKLLAEARQADAQSGKYAAEMATSRAQERYAVVEAKKAELTLAETQRVVLRELAKDKYNQLYRFYGAVTEPTVKVALDELTIWRRMHPRKPIEIVFDSPGGSVIDGMDLFDFIQEMRRDGHVITTSTRGMAASMGGILLQAGDRRVMGAESYVLIHEIATGVRGKVGEIEDEIKFLSKVADRILGIFATRSAQAYANGTATKPLTKAQLRAGWKRKDWWLSSDECLKFGLVDEVR